MSTSTTIEPKKCIETKGCCEIAIFFGRVYSFNNALKLYHWSVTGKGSYSQHIALDQALGVLTDVLDRLVETVYTLTGEMEIVIPESTAPENIVLFVENFYKEVEYNRALFNEKFIDSIIDDYQEALQQLLYRLKRLE